MIVRKTGSKEIIRVGVAVAALTTACTLSAQETKEKPGTVTIPAGSHYPGPHGCPTLSTSTLPVKTFFLRNVGQASDANDLLTALRLMLDTDTKMYLDRTQNAIMVRGCPDELPIVEKMIEDLDRPRKKYRLSFTLTETDAGRKIGVQHVAMFVEEGQRSTLKSGSKIPIVTGSYAAASNTSQQQMTYLDIGTNFDATAIAAAGDEITLKAKVEQSSVAEEKSGVGPQDPIVRQTVLESSSLLTQGKPQVLGAVDISGTTRKLEIEVVADPVK